MTDKRLPKQEEADKQEYTFKRVQLFKNETLGTGSYGAVCKAKCDQLICAAKLLYPVLFQIQTTPDPGKEHRQPFRRFELECRFLSHINHPNIVQYLGTYRDPETNAPVLLMELMDESLTHFLESSPGDIPYHIQVNLSQDLAQALAFLHANGIIHRDLSSNNVLLIAGSRAKVSDFGMSKFADINKTRLASMTTCPGTPAFMSPEALNEPPVYTEKLDTFSLGVLFVQIITRKFPDPANRFQTMKFPSPQNSFQMIQAMVPIPEVERRQAHISLIESTHPLLPIALECLKDKDEERPSSEILCQSLDALKKGINHKNSAAQHMVTPKEDHEMQAKNRQLEADNESLKSTIIELNEKLDQALRNIQQASQTKDQSNSNEELTITLQQTITQKEGEIAVLKEAQSNKVSEISQSPLPQTQVLLCLPFTILPGSSTEKGHTVYFKSPKTNLFEFSSTKNLWREIPPPPLTDFSIVMVNYESLTTVGGKYIGYFGREKYSEQLYCYEKGKWEKRFPSMPTKRETPGAISTSKILVVAGGSNDSGMVNTVETMNIESKTWSSVSSLPFTSSQPSLAICGDGIYIQPRYTQSKHQQSIVKCSFKELKLSESKSGKWKNICSSPVRFSSLVNVYGRLLVVGGEKMNSDSKGNNCAKEIWEYNEANDSWQVVKEMTEARSGCLTALLPAKKLLVAGGNNDNSDQTMEIVTFH